MPMQRGRLPKLALGREPAVWPALKAGPQVLCCLLFAAQVGALTGELRVERPYRTFLTAVQFCEWKVSHLLQKPIESMCGFLTVLPGAFSAFRWVAVEVRRPLVLVLLVGRWWEVVALGPALRVQKNTGKPWLCTAVLGMGIQRSASARQLESYSSLSSQPSFNTGSVLALSIGRGQAATQHDRLPSALQGEPLRRYFHGLYSQAELNAFEANMYLAEDRVLCLEIVAKKNAAYRCGGVGSVGWDSREWHQCGVGHMGMARGGALLGG